MTERTASGSAFANSDTATAAKGKLKTKTESQTLVAANPARVGLIVCNPGTKDVFLALGGTAVSGEGIWLKKESAPVQINGYTGIVTAISKEEEPEITYAEI